MTIANKEELEGSTEKSQIVGVTIVQDALIGLGPHLEACRHSFIGTNNVIPSGSPGVGLALDHG